MSTIPKLALIPSGVKASKVYSVLPTDGTGDFTFSRAGALPSYNATRVNSEGLIEEVLSNVPRLNYPMIDGVVSGCPSLLLEPQRTNLLTYSEDFINPAWNKTRGYITSNALISPNGTLSADLFTAENDSTAYVQNNVSITVSGSKQSISLFVKKGSTNWCYLLLWDGTANGCYQYFDIENGVVGDEDTFGSGVTVDTTNIEKYPNDWYRISVTYNCSITNLKARISQTNGNLFPSSDTGATIYIWGFQAEANSSYPTSYIPTNGSTVTRVAETANGAGDANTFNDSEGVLFAEVNFQNEFGVSRYLGLHGSNASNRVIFGNSANTSDLTCFVISNGSNLFQKTISLSDISTSHKIVLKYKTNDFSLWVNGFKLEVDDLGDTSNGSLNSLSFVGVVPSTQPFYGNTKQIQYFDSALNDTDLETLTSWTSFYEMAKSQLYTIE